MENLVLKNATFFDSIQGKMVPGKDITIEGTKITNISNSDSTDLNDTNKEIDLSEKFIFPGFIDCHVHLESSSEVDWAKELMRKKQGAEYYVAYNNSLRHLRTGFTTLRDCGGADWGSPLKHSINNGTLVGPNLYVAQKPISQWGNQEFFGPRYLAKFVEEGRVLAGKNGVIEAVRDRKTKGSDFIKTMTSGGVLHGQESQLERTLWKSEELEEMVTEAHRLGMKVASHAHSTNGIQHAVDAGVDSVEHGSIVSEDSLEEMKTKGIFLVPTQTSKFNDKPELMKQLPPEIQQKTNLVDNAMIEHHKVAVQKNVKIACGTDAGVPGNPHGTSHLEIISYVKDLGMNEIRALQSATSIASELIGNKLIGSIKEGNLADLVILEKNPLNNISVLSDMSNYHAVVKSGMIVVKKGRLFLN